MSAYNEIQIYNVNIETRNIISRTLGGKHNSLQKKSNGVTVYCSMIKLIVKDFNKEGNALGRQH